MVQRQTADHTGTTAKETANDMPGSWVDASYIKIRNISLGYTLPKIVDEVHRNFKSSYLLQCFKSVCI